MNTRVTPKKLTEEAIYLAFMLLSFYNDDVTEDSSLAFFEDKIPKLLTYLLEPLKRQLLKIYDATRANDYIYVFSEVLRDPLLKVPSTKYESDRFQRCLNKYTKDKFLEYKVHNFPQYEESRTLL